MDCFCTDSSIHDSGMICFPSILPLFKYNNPQRHLEQAMEERLALLNEKLANLKLSIRHFPETDAVYVRYMGTINEGKLNPGIIEAFRKVESWMEARGLLEDTSMILGVVLDDPYITPPPATQV